MEKLAFIKEQMDSISVPYQFGAWTSKVDFPYIVGEITEEPATTEDGLEESTLILTMFHRGKQRGDMEELKAKIKKHFDPIFGLRAAVDGCAIAVFFDGSYYVPTGEANLEKMQINLKIKEWKGV